MFSPFHILKLHNNGTLHWMEGAASVERAKDRIKALAATSPAEYVITNLTGRKTWIESQGRRVMFQIGYDEKDLSARAELFRSCGHEVISVPDNEAAKRVLVSIQNIDLFVIGHTAPEKTRKEMVDWLKTNFPNVKTIALIPSVNHQLPRADYNIVLNDGDEWMSLLAATAR
jgi:hypothetical protein